jgi:hypothetical protein
MPSAELADLLADTDRAIPLAEQHAAAEHERALDPTQSPNPFAAREQAENAAFAAARLKTLQPRLAARLQQVNAEEQVQAYLSKRAELTLERDALQQEFSATYQELCGKLLELFARLRDFQNRAQIALGNPPSGVAVLEAIQGAAVLEKCVLFDFDNQQVWPPPSGGFAAEFVQGMAAITARAPGPLWGDPGFREAKRAELTREGARISAFHEQQTREQEDRWNAEERQRFQQLQGGQ